MVTPSRPLFAHLFLVLFVTNIVISLLLTQLFVNHHEKSLVQATKYFKERQAELIFASCSNIIATIQGDERQKALMNLCNALDHDGWMSFIDRHGNPIWECNKTAGQYNGPSILSIIKRALAGEKILVWQQGGLSPNLFLSAPVKVNNQINGALLICISTNIHGYSWLQWGALFLGIFSTVTLLALIIAKFISYQVSTPITDLGDWLRKIPYLSLEECGQYNPPEQRGWQYKELALLRDNLIRTCQRFEERLSQIGSELARLKLLFVNMKEAVFLLDPHKRIVTMNASAQLIIKLPETLAKGKPFSAVFRDMRLKEFIDDVFKRMHDMETQISLYTGQEGLEKKTFFVRAVVLKELISGKPTGILLVMDDRTQLKRLEEMRKEFVANVSHELKTPITAIKGYIETLMDGALEDRETAQRFLNIVMRQSRRLEALVEDILLLSRIEAKSEGEEIEILQVDICDLINSSIEACRLRAKEKGITIQVKCPEQRIIMGLNEGLMEQAIINLIINAINYSPEGSSIIIQVVRQRAYVQISVRDFGIGIPKNHLHRIFERFYRVDKARSRKLGGTGLGLAIVKHAVQAHNGTVSVRSEIGKGSIFTIHLPLKEINQSGQ